MADGLGILTVISATAAYFGSDAPAQPLHEAGIERFAPLHADRDLQTTNLVVHWQRKTLASWPIELRLGARVSRVTGHITQLSGSWEDGTLAETRLDSPAWGAGPTLEARYAVIDHGRWSLNLTLDTSVLLYDRSFPAGGDRYNGMFQLGPELAGSLPDGSRLGVSWRWMHVSNGQGMTPHNPSYEGRGLVLRWQAAW